MTKKEKILSNIRELHSIGTAEAMRVAAEMQSELERVTIPRDWLRVVWYSDDCGGKLVRFKAGNPYSQAAETVINQKFNAKYMSNKTDRKEENKLLSDKQDSNSEEIIVCDASDLQIISKASDGRLAASISRTRRRIYEIAACNKWQWFFTGTLDDEKCDRHDLNGTYSRISQYIRDYRKRQQGERITYLIVPEQHKDGAWHFHGLLNGISEAELHKFSLREKLPNRIRETIKKGQEVYTWEGYAERFGFSTLTKVGSHAAVSRYVTKYITKELLSDKHDSNRKLYYASRGLNKPTILAEGHSVNGLLPCCDYENDWVCLKRIDERDEAESICAEYLGVDLSEIK